MNLSNAANGTDQFAEEATQEFMSINPSGNAESFKEGFCYGYNKQKPLPSLFEIHEQVTLDFKEAGTLKNGNIIKVHFTDRKVLYDVELNTLNGEATRIYNIDSCFVKPV